MTDNDTTTNRIELDLGRLYRTTHAGLRRAAMRMGVEADVAEDLVQNTFLVAQRRLSYFDGRSKPETWLFGILFNTYRNHRRTCERAVRRKQSHARLVECGSQDGTPQVYATCLLEQLLGELDVDHREVLMLSAQGLSGPEIAAQFQCSVNTTYSRLYAARRNVQLRLAAEC
ncbi:RNA polymerase sigma factor [Enhygromyxa salina]|uniref:RNA polymerase sigma factor n=1 Tax=Enhygromyxa salina TaxID=215803 RepID=UPI000696695B|nr:RNA polymerase sigma factor [Enhygromyxa salina]